MKASDLRAIITAAEQIIGHDQFDVEFWDDGRSPSFSIAPGHTFDQVDRYLDGQTLQLRIERQQIEGRPVSIDASERTRDILFRAIQPPGPPF